jgi:hypothetical protein
MTPELDTTAFEILEGTPAALRALIGNAPAAALERPLDEGWSAKHVVAHLLDVQSVAFTDRMRRIVAEDRPLFQLIDPSQRLEELGYQSWTVERLLNEFDRTRAGDVAFLRSLSPDDLQRIGQHQEAGEVSVSDLAHYCAVHDMMHLAQIAKMLQAHLSDRVGNMRRYMAEG